MANRIIFALSKQHTGRRSPVGSFGSPGTPPPPQHRSTAWPAGLPRPCSQWSTRHLYGNTSRQHHNTGCGTHAACCLLWLCNFERHLPGRKEPWCCPVTPYTSGSVCADTGHWTLSRGTFRLHLSSRSTHGEAWCDCTSAQADRLPAVQRMWGSDGSLQHRSESRTRPNCRQSEKGTPQ